MKRMCNGGFLSERIERIWKSVTPKQAKRMTGELVETALKWSKLL